MKHLEEIVVSDTVESLAISFENNTTIKYNEYENGLYFGNEKNPYALFIKVKNIKSSSFTLHEDTKNINGAAFKDYTYLRRIALPKTITTINQSVFSGCINLNDIAIHDNIKRIENSAFDGCSSLISIKLPTSLQYIGEKAFQGCSYISTITLPDSVTKISSYCFASMTNLVNVTLNNHIVELPSYVFYGCKNLKNINFCSNIVKINNNAFDSCTGLKNVKLPSKLYYLGSKVFNNCTGISTFEFTENMTNLTASMIEGAKINIIVFTPKHTVETALIENVSYVYFYGSSKECTIDWPDDFKFKWYSASRPSAYSTKCWRYVNGIPTSY